MELDELRFFDRRAEIAHGQNRLPHWEQPGAVYFVTFRLADALPETLLRDWRIERDAWLTRHPGSWTSAVDAEYHRRFSAATERWLDAGHGSCALRTRAYARMVAEALGYFEGRRCVQIAWVVMPNHVHTVFELQPGEELSRLVQSWKRHAAVQINRRRGTVGETLWQKDYFDRLVRDAGHLGRCVRYIRRNPAQEL